MLDLNKEEHAYIIGFLQGDGYCGEYENKGRVGTEIQISDVDILKKIKCVFDSLNINSFLGQRERDTNFSKGYKSCYLTTHSKEFRDEIKNYIPSGKKHLDIKTPTPINEIAYWRGMIDADGTICFSSAGFPIIGLVISSESIKKSFCEFLKDNLGIHKRIKRNTRDSVYNFLITREDAVKLATILYSNSTISLDRKMESAKIVMNWIRPKEMRKRNLLKGKRVWEEWEDKFILEHTIKESSEKLDRTSSSIKTRKWRLNNESNL